MGRRSKRNFYRRCALAHQPTFICQMSESACDDPKILAGALLLAGVSTPALADRIDEVQFRSRKRQSGRPSQRA